MELKKSYPLLPLKPKLEQLLQNVIQSNESGGVNFESGMADVAKDDVKLE